MSGANVPNRSTMASITMLVTWTIYIERNVRVFCHNSTAPTILMENIKKEARLWVIAGAKRFGQKLREE